MQVIDITLDTETTGLVMCQKGTELPGKHDVIQIAAKVRDIVYEAKCQPIRWDSVDQRALDVHGYQIADLRTFRPSGVMCVEFREWLSVLRDPGCMFRMVAHNMPFDYKGARSWFIKNGFGDWDNFFLPQEDSICTKKLGNRAKKAGHLPGIENMKLITCAKYIGFKFDAHDALGDTLACEAFHNHLKGLPNYVAETGGVSMQELRDEGKEPMGSDGLAELAELEKLEAEVTGSIVL
jgi:hypothetical protein